MLFILLLIDTNVNLLGLYNNPKDPAVIPILTIPINSSKPIDSTGIESIVLVTDNIIALQTAVH